MGVDGVVGGVVAAWWHGVVGDVVGGVVDGSTTFSCALPWPGSVATSPAYSATSSTVPASVNGPTSKVALPSSSSTAGRSVPSTDSTTSPVGAASAAEPTSTTTSPLAPVSSCSGAVTVTSDATFSGSARSMTCTSR